MELTTIILVSIVFIIGLYAFNNFQTIEKVKQKGGMLNKYQILINEFMLDDPNTQIFRHTSLSVILGVENIDGQTYITILQNKNSVKISWVVQSTTFGFHKLEWKFSDRLGHVEMISTIKRDVSNYNKETLVGTTDLNVQDDSTNLQIDERSVSLNLIASKFNCKASEAKSIYFKKMDDMFGSEEDIKSIFGLLPDRMTYEAKKNGINPKNTPSAIYWEWLVEYSKINKLNSPANDVTLISDLHKSNPELLSKLIEAKRIGNDKEFEMLLADNPEYLDLFISNLADLSDEKEEFDDDLPF